MPAVHLIYIYKSTVLTLQTLEETERGARTYSSSPFVARFFHLAEQIDRKTDRNCSSPPEYTIRSGQAGLPNYPLYTVRQITLHGGQLVIMVAMPDPYLAGLLCSSGPLQALCSIL